jgi:hypothetical protein
VGRGPGTRSGDLDPWRVVNRDRYERGQFCLKRRKSFAAAKKLRLKAKRISRTFIRWYKAP